MRQIQKRILLRRPVFCSDDRVRGSAGTRKQYYTGGTERFFSANNHVSYPRVGSKWRKRARSGCSNRRRLWTTADGLRGCRSSKINVAAKSTRRSCVYLAFAEHQPTCLLRGGRIALMQSAAGVNLARIHLDIRHFLGDFSEIVFARESFFFLVVFPCTEIERELRRESRPDTRLRRPYARARVALTTWYRLATTHARK